MRNDFVPLFLDGNHARAAQGARLLVSIAPGKEYSQAERKTIVEWIKKGGILHLHGRLRAGRPGPVAHVRFALTTSAATPRTWRWDKGSRWRWGISGPPFFRGNDYEAYGPLPRRLADRRPGPAPMVIS